jgi:anti-sigma factor RsiW
VTGHARGGCARWRGALLDLVDGELGVAGRAALQAHLASCPTCSAEALETAQLMSGLRRLREQDRAIRTPDDVWPRVVERLSATSRGPLPRVAVRTRPRAPRSTVLMLAAACLALAVSLAGEPIGGTVSDGPPLGEPAHLDRVVLDPPAGTAPPVVLDPVYRSVPRSAGPGGVGLGHE